MFKDIAHIVFFKADCLTLRSQTPGAFNGPEQHILHFVHVLRSIFLKGLASAADIPGSVPPIHGTTRQGLWEPSATSGQR